MGLFSFFNKNKQEATAEDSGYYSRDDQAAATRARSKRASSAGEPAARRGKESKAADDPVLPEKKRARRRLVGAIALALAVAVGLPMVLDSEPKPLSSNISIQIPSRDKAPPLPLPAAPGAAVTPADSLDKREQFIEAPKPDPAEIKTVTLDSRSAEPPKPESKPEPKAVARVEPKPAVKAPLKAEEKIAAKPAQSPEEAARAMAILEGKAPDATGQKFVVQVAALATQEKVNELQGKLREAGIKSFTRKVPTASGERIQVRIGPSSREEADKMRTRLDKIGLSGSMVRPDGK